MKENNFEMLKSFVDEKNKRDMAIDNVGGSGNVGGESVVENINKGNPHYPKVRNLNRTNVLGSLRNRLIELILESPYISEFLMIDASYSWEGDLISRLRNTGGDISVPMVISGKDRNGNWIFYDIWAFRKCN